MKYRRLFGVFLMTLIIALTACGSRTTPSSTTPTRVQVTLSDFKIQSSQTTFATNTPYHFVVTNVGQTNHEFMIMQSMMGQMSMGDMDKMALYHMDASQLPPNTTKSFDFTFAKPATQGTLEFACHLAGHYEAGMRLAITVN